MKDNNYCNKNSEEFVDFDFFKILFDPVRFELIKSISMNPNQSIGEISKAFKQDRSVISRHLEQLYQQGILIKKKESRFTFYKVNCHTIIEKFEKMTDFLKETMKSC